MSDYYIGQIFIENPVTGECYPDDLHIWCGQNNAQITEIDPITKEFEEPLITEKFVAEPEPHVERTETTQMVLHTVRRFQVEELPPPPPPTREDIRMQRIMYRHEHIDDKTLERNRKMANGTWTEENETEYLALDAEVTAYIEEHYPYPEE